MKRISTNKSTTRKSDARPSSPLDLSTVKTTNDAVPRTRERIFGLTEAPTYHPTTEEFKDPLGYIRLIQPEAEQYGIIKIVPPKNYKPDFCLNTEIFRFRTRIQKLNSMEGETRTNLNYLEQLQKFHKLHGRPIQRIPHLDKRPIDLYKLKKEVAQKGGYQKVCDEKRWAEIGRELDYTRRQCTSMSNALKSAYSRVILPYELWLAKYKNRSTPVPVDTHDDDDDDHASEDSSQLCEICHTDDNAHQLLLCDDCDRAYHMSCLSPPLTSVPPAEWYCIKCLTAAGGDYGFEDGDEYSLSDFQTFCDNFKKKWFSKKQPVEQSQLVTEEDCEDEFWRLVDDPHETCQVEYGADLHSTQHGSGFASVERGPDGVKGDDPWNLNMIPILPDSLFTHIKTDISGMMVPWLYIGMCFSAFCWHNEDHFTYSINYMHWGETKTWYGVPGEDTAKFEDTMKKAVPELFEQQPNLLFQLVTMLSPGRLLKEKVRVYAVDQRPGEFVVTFPKAYHSGFNHGFNFCEAVNFAPVDWVHLGLECVKRYKEYRRQPCFSHDELLVNVLKMDLTKKNAKWLKDALQDMQERETTERKQCKKKHPQIKQLGWYDNDDSNEQLQCLFCHCYTYLSHVTCSCTKRVACLNHIDELCECSDNKKNVRIRFSDEQLGQLVEVAFKVARTTSDWESKTRQIFSGGTLPSIQHLQQLLKEADNIGVPFEETRQVRNFLAQVQQWEHQASAFLEPIDGLNQQITFDLKVNYNGDRYRQLTSLLKESKTIAFESPTINRLENLKNEIDEFKQQARSLVSKEDIATSEIEHMLHRGTSLKTDVEEMGLLVITLRQRYWMDVLEPRAMQLPLDHSAILDLKKEADECNIPTSNAKYQAMENKLRLGEGWVKHARRLLPGGVGNRDATLEDLDEILNVDQDVPTLRSVYQELQEFRKKISHWMLQFTRTMMQCKQQQLLHRPTAEDVHILQQEMQQFPSAMVQQESATLNHELKRLDDWTMKIKRLLTYRISPPKTFDTILHDMYTNIEHILEMHQESKKPPSHNRYSKKATRPYCVCREPESGFMINCDVCQDWYHGSCVKVSRRQLNPNSSYVCPVCDPSFDFAHFSRRPKFEEICEMMDEAKDLLLVPQVYPKLQEIVLMMTSYRDELYSFCRSKTILGVDDIYTIKQYLRELYGLSIALEDETEFLCKKVRELSNHDRQLQKQNHQQYYQSSNHIHPPTPMDVNIEHQNNNIYPVNSSQHSITTSSSLSQNSFDNTSTSSHMPRPTIKLTLNPPLSPSSTSSLSHYQDDHRNQSYSTTTDLLDKKRKYVPAGENANRRRPRRNSNGFTHLQDGNSSTPTVTPEIRFKSYHY
ncbi:uncharacterized protein BX664DRAFT_325009 [Halteromyces radiatus]|uniref:uncharacterized protein n=1 Tax=Halteromyces radiatus TaxID=101107 RepID=UPI0022210625|nr:uncharacterized protein BX664DRAFT_325009 [Halteromyces radiatus]KAI8096840.1 hypothetical protein BX664DRAFT_325009 [Halteromyces radiatus]